MSDEQPAAIEWTALPGPRRNWIFTICLRAGVVVTTAAAFAAPAQAAPPVTGPSGGRTVMVSIDDHGRQGSGNSLGPQVSANGRYVAFVSSAPNLVPGDTNDTWDVFVRDLWTGTTRRADVTSSGAQAAAGVHGHVRISADGRYVAFLSLSSDLVPGDTNGTSDVFVRDLREGRTTRVSVSSSGGQGDDWSGVTLALSPDGRYVGFDSEAGNLVPGDTNGFLDVFLHDRSTGKTSRISLASDGTQGNHLSQAPAISADGRYVAFESFAENLVPGDANGYSDVFLRDRRTDRTTLISHTPAGVPSEANSFHPTISADASLIAFQSESGDVVPGDTNGMSDTFVQERATGRTTRVSVSSTGAQANDHCNSASISDDGRYVVFSSPATNLVAHDSNAVEDVFVRDLRSRTTTRASVSTSGRQADDWSGDPSISAGGGVVAFASSATDLVLGDTNEAPDSFVHLR